MKTFTMKGGCRFWHAELQMGENDSIIWNFEKIPNTHPTAE